MAPEPTMTAAKYSEYANEEKFGPSLENGKLKTKDPIICMMLREKWAPVEENTLCFCRI
jgi:hypothetical protein